MNSVYPFIKETELESMARSAREALAAISRIVSQKYDVPLDQATTSSLEALRFLRLGQKAEDTQGSLAAIAFFKQAIALDPNFSEGYESLGVNYANFGQSDLVATYLKRAVELSSRISEREKFETFAAYYSVGTRELDKVFEVYQLWEKTYPDDRLAPGNLPMPI